MDVSPTFQSNEINDYLVFSLGKIARMLVAIHINSFDLNNSLSHLWPL